MVIQLEVKVHEISRLHSSSNNAANSISKEKEKDKEKAAVIANKKPVDLPRKDTGCSKRMQELMRQFGTIMRQVRC